MNPATLRCTQCPMTWDVDPEDQDATLADAFGHAERRHPGFYPASIIQAGTE